MSSTSQSSPTKSIEEDTTLLDQSQGKSMSEHLDDESRFEHDSDGTSRPPSQQHSSDDEEENLEDSDPTTGPQASQADPPPVTQNSPPTSPNPRAKKRPRHNKAPSTDLSDPQSTDDSVVPRPLTQEPWDRTLSPGPKHFEFTAAMRRHALHCDIPLRAPDVDPHLRRLYEGGVTGLGSISANDPFLKEELHPIDKSQLDLANALHSIYVHGWLTNVREPSEAKFKLHHPESCAYVRKSFFNRMYDRVRWGLKNHGLALEYYYTYKAKIHYLSTQFDPQPLRTPLWTDCDNPHCQCNPFSSLRLLPFVLCPFPSPPRLPIQITSTSKPRLRAVHVDPTLDSSLTSNSPLLPLASPSTPLYPLTRPSQTVPKRLSPKSKPSHPPSQNRSAKKLSPKSVSSHDARGTARAGTAEKAKGSIANATDPTQDRSTSP
ncbi:uncharacterized protein STEHIDRAFT_159298 [Stereum hirsutum FP-91666 SS1]|uniref:uncharacterized protein n=1 Tax=Stereum hirsutum (strain FP-91666) TaxID=721885 RepID=UPI00044494B9|nr:uncharacterized protein STEHIDRAFT_159298 [Stereum hirsutum FP-91666 SS1]EIM84635.1 hypothetical protein STEHIDRAFT_159298 [Stereum hirsutum FP-91666 SS1]